jgi:nitroalkane oxidase
VPVVAIDFTLSDSQQQLQKNAKDFAEGVLRPVAGQIDRAADGWQAFLAGREAYREMAHAGFTKSFIPASCGGAGFSMLDLAIAAEELTCVDVSVPTTLLGSGLGLQPVIQYGSPEQKERFLRPFADDPEGDLLASYAFTDVGGGANFDSPDPAGGMQTIARRDGEEWVITGEKHYTTTAPDGTRRAASCTPWCAAPTRPRARTTRSP